MNTTPPQHYYFSMPKLAFYVTLKCNLRCKLCAVYAPYYMNPFHPDVKYLCKCLDRYFEIVDYCQLFSISGGEPLIRKDLPEVVEYIHTYNDKIGKLEIITNGTVIPSDKLLESLTLFGNKLNLLVDDYGINKSVNAARVVARFRTIEHAKITHRDYYSSYAHCGGWVDYGISINSKKKTRSASKALFKNCSYPQKLDFCTSMVDGKLYSCTQLRRLIELGVVQPELNEVFDLFDFNYSNDEIRRRISALYNVDCLSACAYCNGICDDSPRYPAAEQL